jgi:hypothetical protein
MLCQWIFFTKLMQLSLFSRGFEIFLNSYYWRLAFFLIFVITFLKIKKELKIEGIFQFAMNMLKNKHHLNIDVWKWRFDFTKCTLCESLKDLISKLGKSNNNVKEYELKLKKHNLH